MYYIEIVHPGNIDSYRDISPDIAARLSNKISPGINYRAAIAFFPGQAAGFALAHDCGTEGKWRLEYVYVLPKYRRSGIALELLRKLEEEIVGMDCKAIFAIFLRDAQDVSGSDMTFSFLKAAGFEPPVPASTVFRCLCEDLCAVYWVRNYPLKELYEKDSITHEQYEIFKWNLLNEDDTRYLLENSGKEYPKWANPLERDAYIRKDLSLGIRHMGRLAGWVVTEHYGGEELYFRASFINEAHRGTKLYLYVFATIMQMQRAVGIRYTSTHIETENKSMQRFMKHALEGRFESIRYELRMIKRPDR